MNPKRKKRLALVLSIVFGGAIAVGLVLYSMDQNINLFYSPTQIANGEVPADQRIRAGGMVVEGSVYRDKESLKVSFGLTDYEGTIEVEYDGILPDLFREGQGIVALGRMNDKNVFVASEVLAKHDEQYMPPEVQQALDKAKGNKAEGNTSAAAGYGS